MCTKGWLYGDRENLFERVITNITDGCVMGYKYFDFGEDFSSKTMELALNINGFGCRGCIHVRLDAEDGEEIGCVEFGMNDGVATGRVKCVTGRHALYFIAESC